ncbi:MAG TPA: DMP19 family protein [Phycisphaerae bacterium]
MYAQFRWIIPLLTLVLIACKEDASRRNRSAGRAREPKARAWVKREALERASDEQLENLVGTCLTHALPDNADREYAVVRTWSPGKRMVYATSALEGEVNNGGFLQFFWNTRGECSQMALEGLKLIGAERHADLLQRAIVIYEQDKRLQRRSGDKLDAEAFSNAERDSRLNPLDDEFYNLTEQLAPLRVKYIRSHLDEFATPS